MQIIEKTVSGAVLLALMMGGVCAQKSLAQTYRGTAVSSRAVAAPEYTSIPVIDHSVEDRYLESLQKLVDCDFQEVTLANMADFIQHQTGVPLHFDERALKDSGADKDTTVSFKASQIPARVALKLILSPMGLTLLAKSNVILITTMETADSELESRVYPVADLVTARHDSVESQNFGSLMDLITSIVAPTSWDEVGGPGSISAFPLKSALVISQTADVHETVVGLIDVLRRLPSAYSAEVRSGIRRLPPLRSVSLGSAERPGNGQPPVLNVERIIGARDLGGDLFNIESAQERFSALSIPPHTSAAPGDAARSDAAQPNVAFPSWRTPRNHRD